MGKISASTLRRVYLLYLLARWQRGAYGLKRVHKIAYIAEREPKAIRPFEFKRYHFGQYSESLEDIKDQLQSMGFVAALPLDTALTLQIEDETYTLGGNKFIVTDRLGVEFYRRVLAAVSEELPRAIDETVNRYGYYTEEKLVELCYAFPEFKGLEHGQVIFESNLPDQVEIDLSDDECDDLELALKPGFVIPMVRLAEALDETDFDWNKVQEVEHLPVPGS